MSTQAVLFDAPGPRTRRRHLLYTLIAGAAVLGLVGYVLAVLWRNGQITPDRWAPIVGAEAWTSYLLPGLQATLLGALISIVLAFLLGLVLAMARMSDMRWLRAVAAVVVEFFRAVPVLIMMLFVFYLLTYLTDVEGMWPSLIGVVVGLVLYNAAVIAEVVRSGVNALPKGQGEAGLSIGLSSLQVRSMILLPQALTAMMPTLVSQLVVVLKDTALGYIILYPELLNSVRQMGTRFGNVTVAFIVGAAVFILVNWLITVVAHRLERRLQRRGHIAAVVINHVEQPLEHQPGGKTTDQ